MYCSHTQGGDRGNDTQPLSIIFIQGVVQMSEVSPNVGFFVLFCFFFQKFISKTHSKQTQLSKVLY